MERTLAVSKAGHDRGRVYVVLREAGEYVFLADGEKKTAENPKKKNRKHIQPVLRIPREAEEILNREENLTDREIRRALKLYRKREDMKEQEETVCRKQI